MVQFLLWLPGTRRAASLASSQCSVLRLMRSENEQSLRSRLNQLFVLRWRSNAAFSSRCLGRLSVQSAFRSHGATVQLSDMQGQDGGNNDGECVKRSSRHTKRGSALLVS